MISSTNNEPQILEQCLATKWQRLSAGVIDLLFCGCIAVAIGFVLNMWQNSEFGTGNSEVMRRAYGLEDVHTNLRAQYGRFLSTTNYGLLGSFIVLWIYHACTESSSKSSTWGKRILKLRVLNKNGEGIGFFKSTFRFLAKLGLTAIWGLLFYIPIISLFDWLVPNAVTPGILVPLYAITFLWFVYLRPAKNRPLTQDKLSGTIVVQSNPQGASGRPSVRNPKETVTV